MREKRCTEVLAVAGHVPKQSKSLLCLISLHHVNILKHARFYILGQNSSEGHQMPKVLAVGLAYLGKSCHTRGAQ